MNHNPDIYLLYEYMDKIPLSYRVKVRLDEKIDVELLKKSVEESIGRFPYYRVQVGVDDEGNYTLTPNDRPIAVAPEQDRRILLGSEETNGHLFAITYRDDTIWFNCAHAVCGAYGFFFWIKTTLYQYMTKKYGTIEPPADIKLPGTEVTDAELFFPKAEDLPKDEPIVRYNGGDTNLAIGRMLKFLLNPFVKDNYYYEIEIPTDTFIQYCTSTDGSPYTVLSAMMYKSLTKVFKEKEGTFLSGRIAADYRDDIGATGSYRDLVRFIHVKYEWNMKDESIEKLNMRARGALVSQNQPELSCERFVRLDNVHKGVDAQPNLKLKKKYAKQNSTFRSDPRDVFTISYVGKMDFGGMEEHIQSIYTITDGDLFLEVNALKKSFNINYQLINKDTAPLERFLEVLREKGIPYKVSERQTRYLPKIKLP